MEVDQEVVGIRVQSSSLCPSQGIGRLLLEAVYKVADDTDVADIIVSPSWLVGTAFVLLVL